MNFFLSWQFLTFQLFALAILGVYLTKPVGSLAGEVAFEQEGFHLFASNLENRAVAAVAIGPRGPNSDERGVWIKPDGTFQVNQLPEGEYQLRVRAPGFNTEYSEGLYVSEGAVTSIHHPIEMTLVTPSVSIASNVRVYTSKEKPLLWADYTGAGHIKVSVYKENLLKLMRDPVLKKKGYTFNDVFSLTFDSYGNDTQESPLPDKEKAVAVFDRDIQPSTEESGRQNFQFGKPLPPGDYVAVVDMNSMDKQDEKFSAMSFSVTDMGIIVKKAPDMTLVRAIDLNTLRPIAGASIGIDDKDKLTPLGKTVVTDARGFATIKLNQKVQIQKKSSDEDTSDDESGGDSSSSNSYLVYGTHAGSTAYDGINYYQGRANQYQTYFYTDRPVYRLGQTVNFKGIIRQAGTVGLINPGKGKKLTITVENPDNNAISTFETTTNDHGTFHGSVHIPDDDKTGNYQVLATLPDGTQSYGGFEVEQYRKPEYQVDVTPTATRITAGEKGEAKVKATYYFGGPVANAKVKYSIYKSPDYGTHLSLMPRPQYYEFFDDWGDDDNGGSDWYASYGGGGDFISDGYVQTDANGEATITYDTTPATRDLNKPYDYDYGDKRYRIEAEVTDMTRMTVVGSGSELVTPADFELFVTPSNYVAKAGDTFDADIAAIGYDGKPVANQQIKVTLNRYRYDLPSRDMQEQEHVTAVTDKDGKAKVSFTSKDQWPCDSFYIIATSDDKSNHMAFGETSIWIANERYPYVASSDAEAQKRAFEVKLDKRVYKPGETAKIMVSSPLSGKEGVEALVSVEGNKIYSYKLVPITSTAQLVEVPIDKTYIPNAYISVCFVGKKHQFYTTEKMIRVSPQQNFLNVTVASNKEKYKPGEIVKYTIKATHPDGKPAPNTELSLGVVDESIYAIRPDTTENIQKFFYSRRSNFVVTSCSFPEEYSGGPDKTEPKVRKDFKDTAAWLPEVTTNKDGIAIASVKMPDNLTTWRATVRGIDTDTDVGAAIQKITVTQDLIVRLGLPRFFTQEDKGQITAVVHNYTTQPQSIKLTLTPSPEFSTKTDLVQTLKVAPDKAQRFSWPVTITQPGTGVIKIKAIGQTASDALEQQIPIRPLGIPAFSIKSGLLTGENDSVQLPIGVSADTAKGTAKYKVSLASSSIGPVLGSFDSLIEYPYGCTEQTMSRMEPSIVAMTLHKTLGLPVDPKMSAKFEKVYKKSIDKLAGYRHADGGWGWWQTDDSQPYLTCLVLDGINQLNHTQKPADPHKEWITGGVTYLKKSSVELEKQLSRPDLVKSNWWWWGWEYDTDLARTMYTISLFEKPDPAILTWVFNRYDHLPPEALSYLTMALENVGQKDNAQKVYQRLVSLANVDGQYMDWDHTPAMYKRMFYTQVWDYSYRYTGTETTALALEAVLAADPNNQQRIESIKQWLLIQHGKDGWENTKTTSEVFRALLAEEVHARSKWPTNFKVDANLNEKLLFDYAFDPDNTYKPEQTFDVPISDKPSTLTIKKDGTGRLYYTGLLTCFRKMHAGDQVAEKASPSGLKLTRHFYHVVPLSMTSDGSMHFKTTEITDGKVTAGETILMKVQVESPINIPYVMMEAMLPSGAEVVQGDAQAEDAQQSNFEGDWGAAWWQHQDILDDRMVFFGTNLPSGKSEFHTLLRIEQPGNLNVDPVSIEGMYTKNVHGYSALDMLKVTE
jgi:hypothetical protein